MHHCRCQRPMSEFLLTRSRVVQTDSVQRMTRQPSRNLLNRNYPHQVLVLSDTVSRTTLESWTFTRRWPSSPRRAQYSRTIAGIRCTVSLTIKKAALFLLTFGRVKVAPERAKYA